MLRGEGEAETGSIELNTCIWFALSENASHMKSIIESVLAVVAFEMRGIKTERYFFKEC